MTALPQMAWVFLRQTNCSIGLRTLKKHDLFSTEVMAVCPSCGLATADSPHASSDLCVRALETEVARLSELIEQFKKQRVEDQPKR